MDFDKRIIAEFFNRYRQKFGQVFQAQVEPLEWLFEMLMKDNRLPLVSHKAYVLATIKHETGATYLPIEEWGKGRGRPYGIPDVETGETYYGRGYVQLTHKYNYKAMGDRLGFDLAHKPELALNRYVAYEVLVQGMVQGLFNGKGKGLLHYINETKVDYVQARRTVNVLDKADHIASLAFKFEDILH